MYTNYFGLQELPFSIAPNPSFMFMSDRHREALAHLSYGLGETGGFVLLTGEVGTGKTTVSRCLLQQLPKNTQVAFILNPTLSSQELLATICDELKVRYRKTGATLKTLTDKIQEKLLKNHEDELNTVLIIDEAQHLQPEVLEQLRLLTNLETNTKKLLQVILIGQPELQQLLQRQDLRQLAQRITARYHLMPLNKQEVVQYIKHRLDVAKSPRMLFNEGAISLIHKLSNGIPRLINLLCDRSLMRAYGSNQTVVNKKLVTVASYEALGQQQQVPKWSQQTMIKVIVSVSLLVSLIIGAALFMGFWFANQNQVTTELLVNNSQTAKLVNSSIETALVPLSEQLAETSVVTTQHIIAQSAEKPIEMTSIKTTTEKSLAIEALQSEQEYTQTIQLESKNLNPTKPEEQRQKKVTQTETKLISNKPKPLPEFKVAAEEGVSDELLTLFQTAIKETERLKATELNNSAPTASSVSSDFKPLTDMPIWLQNGVPSLNFEMHLFESDGNSSVKVNGTERFVGDFIAFDVKLIAIERQRVILQYKGEKFSLPSLSSWE